MTQMSLPFFPPKSGRTHEVYGPGAYAFALTLAAQIKGPFLWVREAWLSEQINPIGSAELIDPSDLLVAQGGDQTEVLAVAEEALRSGALRFVVIELTKEIGLTEGRRLQLAARDGKSTGLAIISEGMGSNAAETRWLCQPEFDRSDSTLQRWELKKNKSGTLGIWYVRWDNTSRRLSLVSSPRE